MTVRTAKRGPYACRAGRLPGAVVAAAVLVVAVLAQSAPSEANFGDDASGNCYWSQVRECYGDSNVHTWYGDLGPRMTTATRAALYGSYDTTTLVIAEAASHTGSVDVFYRHGNLPSGIIGLASCQTWSGHECDHWHVAYDNDGLDGRSDAFLRSVACHETGHTLALHHPNVNNHGWGNDHAAFECMRNGNVFPMHLGTHNVGHINGYYG